MNRTIIQNEINRKKYSNGPYYPNNNLIYSVRTDVNEFPYKRFFRGKMNDLNPNVWEREAGYSPIISKIDTINKVDQSLLLGPNTCFQVPCSTIFPCNIQPSNFQSNNESKVYVSP
jgi:hypothetical protein